MPDDIPEEFEIGELLSAAALNRLQQAILARLAAHDHSGGAKGPPIGTEGLADLSVTTPKLADGAVTAAKLGDGAVTARALAEDAVGAPHLAEGAVETRAIRDAAVTEQKLSTDVRAMLTRVGNGASSASQVIWRDPQVVYPGGGTIGVIGGILNPAEWIWDIGVIAISDDNEPVKLNPNTDPAKILEVIDFGTTLPGEKAIWETQLNWAVEDAADNILSVGAAGVSMAGTVDTMALADVSEPRMMMMRMEAPPTAAPDGPAPTGNSQPVARTRESAEAAAAITPTDSARAAAKRITTIANVDATGKPVAANSAEAITVSAGFSGQETFTSGGGKIDYRALGGTNAGAKQQASEAAGQMLFNLGLDADYANAAQLPQEMIAHLDLAYAGDAGFFDPGKPLWNGGSWLPDILNRPELFGTGYSLSGGRNIRSVTRQFAAGNPDDHWVRVHFITPYRNAAYAVTVTPRSQSKYEMISANIRAKTTAYVDLQFTGADAAAGNTVRFERISKLSFDLAIFGDLGRAT